MLLFPGAPPVGDLVEGKHVFVQDKGILGTTWEDTSWSRAGRGRSERGFCGDCPIGRESGHVPAANFFHPRSESPRI